MRDDADHGSDESEHPSGGLSAGDRHSQDPFHELLREAGRISDTWSEASQPLLPIGSTLCGGRLRIQGCLGQGGMGVVFEAFDVIACGPGHSGCARTR